MKLIEQAQGNIPWLILVIMVMDVTI